MTNSMKYKFLIYIYIFCISCSEKTSIIDESIRIEFNKDQEQKEILLSSFVDKLDVVKLETNNESLIGSVTNIEFHNKQYYISDRFITEKVFLFDNEGKFIKTISNAGKGPGEYMSLDFIAVDKFRDEFIIVDAQSMKLLIFDLTGVFKKELYLNYWICSLYVSDNEYFLYLYDTDKEPFNLIIIDKNTLKVKGKYFQKTPVVDGFVNSNTFFSFKDNLLFSYSLSNAVYDITYILKNEIIKKYSLGLQNLSKEFNNQNEIVEFMEKNNHYYFPFLIHETENYLTLSFLEGKSTQYGIFNKQIQKFIYSKNIVNDINNVPYSQPIGNKCLNQLISVVHPYQLDASNLSYYDSENPLLLIYHFK